MTENQVIHPDQLKQMVRKIENLEEDKGNILAQIKEVYQEAKSQGFDTKTLKQVIKLRQKDRDELAEEDALLELYRTVLEV